MRRQRLPSAARHDPESFAITLGQEQEIRKYLNTLGQGPRMTLGRENRA